MAPVPIDEARGAASIEHSPAQARVIAAALELFARHGVGGTSLQMIADAIGVTKAAVYHQFKTKDEIVLAAAEAELARLAEALEVAETERSPARAQAVAIRQIVDLAVERRRTVSVVLSDPVILGFFSDHEAFREVMERLTRLLLGDDPGPDARIQTAMLTAAISGTVMHPLVVGLDDETVRSHLLWLTQRCVEPPRTRVAGVTARGR